jgi:mannose-6-phosphate isomerase-like protein (cupin superfamily)
MAMEIPVINLNAMMSEIIEPWSPKVITTANDQAIQIALLEGEYHWHEHKDRDELFFVLKGSIVIQLREQPDLRLSEGEIAVIPKGIEHCPISTGRSYVLMLESLEANISKT